MHTILLLAAFLAAQPKAPQPPALFAATPLSVDQMRGKQAVVDTTLGAFVIDLLPEAAPNHVGYFIKLAGERAYDGTTFHRMVKFGIIQGGDPLSKDPAQRDRYGTGGLGVLRAEIGKERMTRGTVAAVVCRASRQRGVAVLRVRGGSTRARRPYTVIGRVAEGMAVVQKISSHRSMPAARRLTASRFGP